MKRLVPIGLLALLAAGCGSVEPIPSDTFYRLETQGVPERLARPWTTDPIAVVSLRANGLLKERAFVESDEAGVTLRQLRYQYWLDTPEQLLKDELVAYLRKVGAASIVLDEGEPAAAFEIGGRILRFERTKGAQGTRAEIALELVLRDRRHAKVLLAKEYTRSADVPADTVGAAVAAMAAGVRGIFGDFTADADRLLSSPPLSARSGD